MGAGTGSQKKTPGVSGGAKGERGGPEGTIGTSKRGSIGSFQQGIADAATGQCTKGEPPARLGFRRTGEPGVAEVSPRRGGQAAPAQATAARTH